MAKYRTIQINFWQDPYIERLSSSAKLIYIYLITCSCISNLGVAQITPRFVSFQTGLPEEDVKLTLAQLEADGKIVRDEDYLWIVSFIKNQTSTSPKILKSLHDEIEELHSAKILQAIACVYPMLEITEEEIQERIPKTQKLRTADGVAALRQQTYSAEMKEEFSASSDNAAELTEYEQASLTFDDLPECGSEALSADLSKHDNNQTIRQENYKSYDTLSIPYRE